MSGGINYSKFDNIQVSSSDEESVRRKPHVTTLNTKDKVVIGPDGLTVLKKENAQDEINRKEEEKNKSKQLESGKENGTERTTSKIQDDITFCGECRQNGEAVKKEEKHYGEKEEKGEENGNKEKKLNKVETEKEKQMKKEKQIKNMLENGSVVPHEYIWSQSAHEIFAHLVLPKNTKAKDLLVEIYEDKLIVKRKESDIKHKNEKTNNDEKVKTDNDEKTKTNNDEQAKTDDVLPTEKMGRSDDGCTVLINKMFPFKVCTNEDTQIWEIKNMNVNWKELWDFSNTINNQDNIQFNFEHDLLVNNNETLLYISLKKINEISNSHIWWSSLFKGESQINVTKLPARASANKKNNLSNFKNMWDQAHQIFKENILKKKLPIPLDD